MQDNNRIFEQVKMPVARPVHTRGMLWVGAAAALTLLSAVSGWGITSLLLFVTGVFYICFRDPARVMPVAEGIVAAPVDGILTKIDRAAWPVEAEQDGETLRLIINPRFYDAHVVRAPAPSSVSGVQHVMGQWGSNVFEKNEPGNERAVIMFKLSDGRGLALEIVGGAMAERIRMGARAGDVVSLGQAIGYSMFGGEARLYLPEGIEVIAQPGQRMIAGETAIAALDAAAHANHPAHHEYANDEVRIDDLGVLPNSAGFKF